jgi:tRNA/rRNA methyltransferase
MIFTSPAIVLVEPQLSRNIGSTARAMWNFGLNDLRLVNPQPHWYDSDARSLAASARDMLKDVRVYDTVENAIADLTTVYATTARHRDMNKEVYTPHQLASATQGKNGLGILFGPEKTGLENHHIVLCDGIISIPVNAECPSLNLSQAVLLMAYEFFIGHHRYQDSQGTGLSKNFESLPSVSLDNPLLHDDRASRQDMVQLFEHLEKELDQAGYFRVDHKKEVMSQTLRNIFGRIHMNPQEVKTLRGVIATLVNPHGIFSRKTKRRP